MNMAQQKGDVKLDENKQNELLLMYKKKYLTVTCNEKLNCSFDKWYKIFRKQTIKSRIIPINQAFIDYLKADGLKLPPQIQSEMDNYYDLDSDNDSDYGNDEDFKQNQEEKTDNNDGIDYHQMDDLFDKIKEKIDALKGAVVPKLNWSAPKDAKWINMETLKCENITQILLLLKASQFVQHDLCYPFYGCIDYDENKGVKVEYKLILRKYSNLNPNREFRCFVYGNQLIAITQRNDDDCFDELQSELRRNKISECIDGFFGEYVVDKFMNDNYVMDVYVDKDYNVYIIDFNPFYELTDCGAMLSWIDICKCIDEINEKGGIKGNEILFAYVDSNETAKIKFNRNSQFRYPIDAVDLKNEKIRG